MSDELSALHESVTHLRTLVAALGPDQIRGPAYPSAWTIADTLSHIGSGAVISRHGLEVVVGGGPADPGFNQSVWDEWNAKGPDAQAADAVEADRALMEALDAVDDGHREAFHLEMGPFDLDFSGYLALRLNEHVLHTWDIEVAGDPAASLPPDASAVILRRLGVIAGFAGKAVGAERTVRIATTGPDGGVEVSLGADAVELTVGDVEHPDLVLPTEAFVRLVYGRLDPEHTPPVGGAHPGVLDELREAFPGF